MDKIKLSWKKIDKTEKFVISGLLVGIVGTYAFGILNIKYGKKPDKIDREYFNLSTREQMMCPPSQFRFKKSYDYCLTNYADTNGDKLITESEINEFDKKLMKDKSSTLVSGELPRYYNGALVPLEEVNRWLEEYINEQRNRTIEEENKRLRELQTPEKLEKLNEWLRGPH